MNFAKQHGERTCIGCRGVFRKDQVVRISAGPEGAVIDYREKLPGRGAYVCPKKECIKKALEREALSRALRIKTKTPGPEEFAVMLLSAVKDRIRSLILMAAKAGRLSSGFSAVRDGMEKGRVEAIIYASDISDGTKEKISAGSNMQEVRVITLFTRDEMGRMLGRELVAALGIEDSGFAEAITKEAERLKGLINVAW